MFLDKLEKLEEKDFRKEYIIGLLQSYQPAWSKLLGERVFLEWKNNEIRIILSRGRSIPIIEASKRIRKDLNWQEIYGYLWIIKTVDEMLKRLSSREAEAVFYRYIQHDFEKADVEFEFTTGMIWKTLSWDKIAQRMKVTRETAREYAERALNKILNMVFP